ncbi:MAG TPA: MFS transporter [Tabrizicola sp.]|nr:MFS transporter [Tabrizicola sp.]
MRNNFFRSYWFWHCGEGFQTILMMWYMTFHARLSASEIGFYQALQLAPFLAFAALGGRLTDRIGARVSFAASTGGFALGLALYGTAEHVMGFSPWLFAAYCLLSGLLSAISNPAIDTFIPDATPRPATRNALIAATVHNTAKLSGNAATLLLPFLSALGGFVANGLLMAGSVFFLLRHPRPAARPLVPVTRLAATLPHLRAHFRAHPASFDILLASVALGLFLIPGFYIFQPLSLRTWFPEHAGLMGLVGVIGWIAAILASGLAARWAARIARPGRLALGVWAAVGASFMALPVAPNLAALLGIFFFAGINGLGKALVYGHYLRDAPETDRGLLIGIDQTAYWGLATLGTLGLGVLVEQIGLTAAILANSSVFLCLVLVLALRRRIGSLQAGA